MQEATGSSPVRSTIEILKMISNLVSRRPRHPMPDFVQRALTNSHLMPAYEARPPYQQNDYLGWIIRAVREETKRSRLNQMLDELKKGDVYMKMSWKKKIV